MLVNHPSRELLHCICFNLLRCDRILWRGDGTSQLSYYRGESKFSDHRPVRGTFIVEVEALNRKAKRRSSNADMRIGAEELLPKDKNKGKDTARCSCFKQGNMLCRLQWWVHILLRKCLWEEE